MSRKPSKRTINAYNEMVSKINKYRCEMLKTRRREAEKRHTGLGLGLPSLPDMAIPKRLRRINNVNRKAIMRRNLSEELKLLKSQYNVNGYPKRYKQNYLEALENIIESFNPNAIPDTQFKTYSKEMMDLYPELESVMRTYNRFKQMGIPQFMDMYEKGYIVELRFIYMGLLDDKEYEPIEEQNALLRDYTRLIRRKRERTQIDDLRDVKDTRITQYGRKKMKGK